MRVLVTGGAGFIGSHVVEALEGEAHDVQILDDFSTGSLMNLPGRFLDVPGRDICVWPDVDYVFEDFRPEVILHLAAQSAISTAWGKPWRDAAVNICGTLNLIMAAKKYDVRRIVLASTSAVYHPLATRWGAHEFSEVAPESPYGISKLTAERYLELMFKEVTILRLGNVYGPRQVSIGENQVVPRMINHILYKTPFFIHGDGSQIRDYVYVEDVARAFLLAMEHKDFEVFNIASGASTTVMTLAGILDTLLETATDWQHDQADPREMVRLHNYKARELLGWQATTSLTKGLQKTLAYGRWHEQP